MAAVESDAPDLSRLRVGQGFDVHPFEKGRALKLGGCGVPHHSGLAGHSDADVLLHAITDAVLGAAGEGDIGQWFPDTDQKYAGADSAELLSAVWEKLSKAGWQVVNCDAMILAEQPKLAPHIPAMRERIAQILHVESGRISVKATTTERLGFVGREEGMAASAIVLMIRS